jgi:hypothetical protein
VSNSLPAQQGKTWSQLSADFKKVMTSDASCTSELMKYNCYTL